MVRETPPSPSLLTQPRPNRILGFPPLRWPAATKSFLPSPEKFTAVSGAAPYDTAIQGTQVFEVENSNGTDVGSFTRDVTTTTDLAGTNTRRSSPPRTSQAR